MSLPFATTGLYILPAEDGHLHAIMDPGHSHSPGADDRTYLTILPAPDGHTHEVLDFGHQHSEGEIALTEIRLAVSRGHTHEVRESGHQHL
jgi:hypothetical protein